MADMLTELELNMQFRDLSITSAASFAVLESEFTEDPVALISARRSFYKKYAPSFMEVCRKERVIETLDGEVKYPVLVWTAQWEHGKVSKVPGIIQNHNDHLPTYPLNEYVDFSTPQLHFLRI